jgi:transcriptional regulator with XRE-family HTH domain
MPTLLGDRIRQARIDYGMSQAELARRIGMSKQSLYDIETNRTLDPGVLKVLAIADTLRVSLNMLLGREEAARERRHDNAAAPTPPKRLRPRKAAPVG